MLAHHTRVTGRSGIFVAAVSTVKQFHAKIKAHWAMKGEKREKSEVLTFIQTTKHFFLSFFKLNVQLCLPKTYLYGTDVLMMEMNPYILGPEFNGA